MRNLPVYDAPGRLQIDWNFESKAIVSTWSTYSVTLEEFKEAVMHRAVNYAKARGAIAWISNASNAQGAFRQEIQTYIGEALFPRFAEAGFKYFISVLPKNALTASAARSFARKIGPNGITLIEVPSVEAAIEFLKASRAKAA